MPETPRVAVRELLLADGHPPVLELTVIAGEGGLDREITNPSIQKTGLALAGYDAYLHAGRILVLAESEIRFLEGLSAGERTAVIRRVLARDLPCLLVTEGLQMVPELPAEAARAHVPILGTPRSTPTAIARLTAVLDDLLAPRGVIHGVLMDILGLGVLIVGESGIGKSECALDLVVRGHRLVADDAVEVRRRGGSVVLGRCPGLTRDHMEIRGIGVINVTDLFGVASTRSSKRIEFVVQLERWLADGEYERLGLDELHYDILGTRIPTVRMPVAPGRNVAILVEVAARNQLLRARGRHAARRLSARLDDELRAGEAEDASARAGDAGVVPR